jgi:catechol 2,3-dioxygenase-like lactoylglutathione lyase family enzyme
VRIKAIIETAIYVDDLDAAEDFYGETLGLRVMDKEPGRHVCFQVGEAGFEFLTPGSDGLFTVGHETRPACEGDVNLPAPRP